VTTYLLITFFPAVINIGLGVYTWSRNPEARENRLLALSCIGLSIYCFRTFEVNTRSLEIADAIYPMFKFGPLMAGAALSDFIMTISGRPLFVKRQIEIGIIYIPISLFAIGAVFTDWFYQGMVVTDEGHYIPQSGPLSEFEAFFVLALLLIAIGKGIRTFFSSPNYNQRKQLLWSLSGIGVSVLLISIILYIPDSIISFAEANSFMIIFVTFSTNLIAGTMVYAIARYGLAPSMEELRRREAEARAHEAELQQQLLDVQIREERRRQEDLQRELDTAHAMQMGLMPSTSPAIKGLSIVGRCVPATEVGGDYFQYFEQDDKLSFCLADVTGHAMQAAIPVVLFSGILESQMELDSPIDVLFARLNRSLHRVLDRRTFACFCMAQFDINTKALRISNAGCPYPYHYNAETEQVSECEIDAYPLGVREENTYTLQKFDLHAGDMVVLHSDGLVEAENAAGELFGDERISQIVQEAGKAGTDPETLLAHLFDEVERFAEGRPAEDDRTCVVLRVDA